MPLPDTVTVGCSLIQDDDEAEKEHDNYNTSVKVENTILPANQDESIHDKINYFQTNADLKQLQKGVNSTVTILKPEMETTSVNCTECGQTLGCKRNLRVHTKVVHDKIKDFFCDSCPKAFGTKSLLGQHQQECTLQSGSLNVLSVAKVVCPKENLLIT